MNKKIFLLMFIMIFLFGSISAITFSSIDDKVSFKNEGRYGTYEINDTTFWFFNNKPVKTIELIENEYSVLNAWKIEEIELFRNSKLFDRTDYFDITQKKDRSNLIKSEEHLYRELVTRERLIPDMSCDKYSFNVSNGSSEYCSEWSNDSYVEAYEDWSDWEEYNFDTKQPGLYQIKTEVTRNNINSGAIEWVDTNDGHKLDKWLTWWDEDWNFKRLLNVTETSGSSFTNYSTLIYVNYTEDTDSKANTNFSDLRFINSTETGELDYWIENKTDSSFAWIWVKVPALTASSNTTLYMYYGNSFASSNSNIFNTFIYGNDGTVDDFVDDLISTCTASLEGGAIKMVSGAVSWDSCGVNIGTTFSTGDFELAFNERASNRGGTSQGGLSLAELTLGNAYDGTPQRMINAATGQFTAWDSSSQNFGSYTNFTWVRTSLDVDIDSITTSFGANVTSVNSTGGLNTYNDFGYRGSMANIRYIRTSQFNIDYWADDIIFREKASSEPTTTFGVEESLIGVITTLISPANNANQTIPEVNFTYSSTPSNTNLTNSTLSIWYANGTLLTTNFTSLSGNETINTTNFHNFTEEGNYLWNAETCGDEVSCVSSQVNFTVIIHLTPSTIIIFDPVGDQGSFVLGNNLTLNWSIQEEGQNVSQHVINCSYTYNSIQTFLNLTQCVDINQTSFLYVNGINNLTFTAVDEFNLESTNSTTWGFTFLEEGVDFNSTAFETDFQAFEINLTTSINLITVSSVLNYNGTEDISDVSCVGGQCNIMNELDIPLVSSGENENKSFFWQIQIFNGTDSIQVNTSDRNQNISRTHLEVCNVTFVNQTLNFTAFDEETLANVNPFKIGITAETWLGTGSVKRTGSIENSSLPSLQLCIDPANRTFHIDADVEYDQISPSDYTERNYFFQNDTITNESQDIELGLLNSTDSTTFILRVQDTDILPVGDVLIFTQRWYPGEGVFRTVQVSRTDDNGKTVGFFQQETVDYRFILKQGGATVLITDIQKIIGEEVPFTLTFTIGADVGAPWEPFEPTDNLTSNLTWNPTTELVSWTYSDTSGDFEEGNLIVESFNASGLNTVICNSTSVQSSATLGCDLSTNQTGTYIARTFITRSGVQSLDKQFTFEIEDVSDIYGRMGLFGGLFILIACAFVFKFNEIAGMWVMVAGVILVNSLGLIAFGKVFISSLIAVTILISFILER